MQEVFLSYSFKKTFSLWIYFHTLYTLQTFTRSYGILGTCYSTPRSIHTIHSYRKDF